jgi:uncharacterized membrane protein YuzA (DUF378 family)
MIVGLLGIMQIAYLYYEREGERERERERIPCNK